MGKQLIITPDILAKTEYDLWEDVEDRYFFDYDSYEIVSKENVNEGSYFIPLVHVAQVKVMKAFIDDLNDRSITNVFKNLPEKDIWGRFWNYFDDDGIRSSRWGNFESGYLRNMTEDWCKDNGISYRIAF